MSVSPFSRSVLRAQPPPQAYGVLLGSALGGPRPWRVPCVAAKAGARCCRSDRFDQAPAGRVEPFPQVAAFGARRRRQSAAQECEHDQDSQTLHDGGPPMRAARLVTEMTYAGEHHREAALVGGGDHLVVAHAAARLDHRRGAGVGDDVEAVAEREERVGRDDRAGEREAGVLRLDARRCASSRRGSSGRRRRRACTPSRAIDDGVRLDELGDAPGEEQIAHPARASARAS